MIPGDDSNGNWHHRGAAEERTTRSHAPSRSVRTTRPSSLKIINIPQVLKTLLRMAFPKNGDLLTPDLLEVDVPKNGDLLTSEFART